MIALIAAVPLETELLRRVMSPSEVQACGHLELYRGMLSGQAVALLHCGVGKANAGAATALVLHRLQPRLTVLFGCGGAYPGSGLGVGDLALASREIYGDEGVAAPGGFLDMRDLELPLARHRGGVYYNSFPVDAALLARARQAIDQAGSGPACPAGPFVTVSTCSGTDQRGAELARRHGALVENMEGAAVAQLCLRYQVPFLEIRGISNPVADRNLADWDLPRGAAAAQRALLAFLAARPHLEEPA